MEVLMLLLLAKVTRKLLMLLLLVKVALGLGWKLT